jgi:ATP-dependent helicase Lhr and Lhr-like helicase
MDVDGLKNVLRAIESGSIRCIAVDTPVPSQFSHEILNANPYAYLDDAPLEERRARAVEMRRVLPASVLEEVGKLEPAAIAQVKTEAWPDVRDSDELHDVLHTLVALPEDWETALPSVAGNVDLPDGSAWRGYFEQLTLQSRAGVAVVAASSASDERTSSRRYWVAAEKARSFLRLFPTAQFTQALPPVET